MPKIKYQPPKYCKIKIKKKQYAAIYLHSKTIYLGAYGSPESKIAYIRLVAEFNVDVARGIYFPRFSPEGIVRCYFHRFKRF